MGRLQRLDRMINHVCMDNDTIQLNEAILGVHHTPTKSTVRNEYRSNPDTKFRYNAEAIYDDILSALKEFEFEGFRGGNRLNITNLDKVMNTLRSRCILQLAFVFRVSHLGGPVYMISKLNDMSKPIMDIVMYFVNEIVQTAYRYGNQICSQFPMGQIISIETLRTSVRIIVDNRLTTANTRDEIVRGLDKLIGEWAKHPYDDYVRNCTTCYEETEYLIRRKLSEVGMSRS